MTEAISNNESLMTIFRLNWSNCTTQQQQISTVNGHCQVLTRAVNQHWRSARSKDGLLIQTILSWWPHPAPNNRFHTLWLHLDYQSSWENKAIMLIMLIASKTLNSCIKQFRLQPIHAEMVTMTSYIWPVSRPYEPSPNMRTKKGFTSQMRKAAAGPWPV